jgi:Uncharacterized conserved protein
MKVLVFNVIYSENLGDGLLAQCLEKVLRRSGNIEVETVDLAGRPDFGTTSARRRSALRLLHALPAFARQRAVSHALRSKLRTLAREWDEKIASADAIVLGGGNLFQDDDLNFPLKIGTLLDCVRRSGKPLAIFAVGVARDWSPQAHALFQQVDDTNLVYLSVRDEASRYNWQNHFAAAPEPSVVPDPGFLAAQLVGAGSMVAASAQTYVVGICVTDPLILARHSGKRRTPICMRTTKEYVQLIRLLITRGHPVRLFCNGAREDQAFAERIFLDPRLARFRTTEALQLFVRPRTPAELLGILRSTSVILAHRLHACIAAYALGIPHVGIGWDQKVSSFFRSVWRDGFFADDRGTTPEQLAFLLEWAVESGIDHSDRTASLTAAQDAVRELGNRLLSCTVKDGLKANDRGLIAIRQNDEPILLARN